MWCTLCLIKNKFILGFLLNSTLILILIDCECESAFWPCVNHSHSCTSRWLPQICSDQSSSWRSSIHFHKKLKITQTIYINAAVSINRTPPHPYRISSLLEMMTGHLRSNEKLLMRVILCVPGNNVSLIYILNVKINLMNNKYPMSTFTIR